MTEEINKDFLRGYRMGHEEAKAEFLERGISMGVKQEHERIQSVLNMQIQWALEADRSIAPLLNRIKKEIGSFLTGESSDDETDMADFE